MAKTEKKNTVKDVDVFWTDDDIEKIQLKPNLYIQKYGTAGCNHIGREIAQNAYDECIDTTSPGENITIRYDRKVDRLTVIDDGRGFPEAKFPLDIFCTKIQSGSKSNRSQSGGTAGEFGVGMSVTNALASEFSVKSYRANEKTIHTIKFVNGKKVSDVTEKNPKGLHGSEVAFIPNPKYLGKGSHIDFDEFYEWIQKNSYLLSSEGKKITVKVEVMDGLKTIKKETIKTKPFSELLDTIVAKPAVEPVHIHARTKFDEEDIEGKKSKKDVLFELSFVYDSISDVAEPCRIDSYCNYTNTKDGGTHVVAADDCICRYLQTKTRASLTDKEKEKMDILWQDVRGDLRMVVNLNSNAQVQFVGNAKTKIGNEALLPIFKEMLNNAIDAVFTKNPSLLSEYCKIVKKNAKARIELNKIKSVNTKVKTNAFHDNLDDNFTPCNNRGKQYKELYLVEGQRSAMGSIVDGRNPDIQAVMGFRGNTANAYKRDLYGITQNAEWKQYCNKIHFDLKTQDIKDLYYDKIIIATDADSDGYFIASSICAFHLKFARPIVEAGKLYRVYPPLYRIDDKDHPYVRDKMEFTAAYRDKIVSNFKLALKTHGADKLKKGEMREFVENTSDYLYMVNLIANHYSVSRRLIEVIAYNLIMYAAAKKHELTVQAMESGLKDQKLITKMMNEIQKLMPEMQTIQGSRIVGDIDGHHQAFNITAGFLDKILSLADIYIQYGLYVTYEEKSASAVYGTLGDFLQQSTKYMPSILTRYKGLGEASWDQIASTIMDPSKRIIIQLTIEDLEHDLETMAILHARTKKEQELRKKMMRDYKLSREEIDT